MLLHVERLKKKKPDKTIMKMKEEIYIDRYAISMKRLVVNTTTHVSSLGIQICNLSIASWVVSGVFYFRFWDGKGLDLSLYFMAKKYFKTPRKVLKTKDIFAANTPDSLFCCLLSYNYDEKVLLIFLRNISYSLLLLSPYVTCTYIKK